ncbi:hypothetical protein DNHGIG_38710 [Collibacillus ludicampi]|uniref:Uncharacterized protein n=1 Tax=Collibacillus ludicampi TaxID=2771369 RepID=A0AAV4LKE4_9BACL|nr:hypothetical protein [Collibacillus ludicampi]GIM48322.1 hypothetical protein DNHGIG_38710 [Collibacillus ludicampi]
MTLWRYFKIASGILNVVAGVLAFNDFIRRRRRMIDFARKIIARNIK